jgi:hypothetical protein
MTLASLVAMMGVPRCCACDRPPEPDKPLYRVNGPSAPGPLWCCRADYVFTLMRTPGPNTERLTVEDLRK